MSAVRKEAPDPADHDQRVFLHEVSWDDLERVIAIRGDAAGPRLTYCEGELELMSPSVHHERIKTLLARLLYTYAEERGVELNGYGSWTLTSEPRERAVEPDECFVLGHEQRTPDLAIEVIWTRGGLDKLPIYAGLGVREVWIWKDGAIEVHRLSGAAYVPAARSEIFPDLDLSELAALSGLANQTEAVREYRARLRAAAPPRGP